MESQFTSYLPHALWLLVGLAMLYCAARGAVGLRAPRDSRLIFAGFSAAGFLLLLLFLETWGARQDIAFWRSRTVFPGEDYEKMRGLVTALLATAGSAGAALAAIRLRGIEAVSRRALRILFLCLFPTTFLFYTQDVATGPLIYKELVACVIVGMMAPAWVLRALAAGRLRLLSSPYNAPLLFFWAICGISVTWAPDWFLSLTNFVYITCFVAAFFMIAPELKDRRYVILLVSTALLCIVVVSLGSLSQFSGRYWGGVLYTPPEGNVRAALGSTIGHNNPVADVMMIGIIYLLGLFLYLRRPSKGLLFVPAVLFLVVIVAATTRGIWLTLPVALFYFERLHRRLLGQKGAAERWGRRVARWAFVGSAALLVLVCVLLLVNSIAARPGGQYSSIPLAQRLQDFTGEANIKGTRPRLWTISMTMIADQVFGAPPAGWFAETAADAAPEGLRPPIHAGGPPLLGLGLSAFKWYYPIYQARFFEEHPAPLIWPTHLHTERVHNEYLQPVVELGVPGAVFIIWVLLAHLAFMKRLRASPADRGTRILRVLLATAVFAGLVHAVVNFSFHTAPLAVLLVSNVAALAALGPTRVREWRFATVYENPSLLIAGLGVTLLVSGLLTVFCGRILYSELYLNIARSFVREAHASSSGNVQNRTSALNMAKAGQAYFQMGLDQAPRMYYLNLEMAQCEMLIFDLERELSGAPRLEVLIEALKAHNRGMEEYQHKSAYLKRGILLRDLAQFVRQSNLGAQPRVSDDVIAYLRTRAMGDAEKDLRIAADIFPIFYASPVTDEDLQPLHELGRLYYGQNRMDEAFETWGRIVRKQPTYVERFHLAEAREAEARGDIPQAGIAYKTALALAPDNQEIWKSLANFYLAHRLRDKAVELARQYVLKEPQSIVAFDVMAYVAHVTGRPEAFFDLARKYVETYGVFKENQRPVSLYTLALLNRADHDMTEAWLGLLSESTAGDSERQFVRNFRLRVAATRQNWPHSLATAESVLAEAPDDPTAPGFELATMINLLTPVLTTASVAPESPAPTD